MKSFLNDLKGIKFNYKLGKKTWFGSGGNSRLFIEINSESNFIVKFNNSSENFSDEIIFLPIGSHEIDITNHVYETIILTLPIRRIHPKVKDGTLENEITIKLKELEPNLENQTFENDSRWDKLKDLK